MRYAPYEQDVHAFAIMNEAQLLEYFLTRVFETEEVWGLDDGCEWITRESNGQMIMPVWPYQQLAAMDAADSEGASPTAESLEDFVYQTLGQLMEEDIVLAVMGSTSQRGCLVSPHRLYEIFTGMFNAGEYTLDS